MAVAGHNAVQPQHIQDRLEEVDDLNSQVLAALEALRGMLPQALAAEERSAFAPLRQRARIKPFAVPANLQPGLAPQLLEVPQPAALRRLVPGAVASHRRAVEQAEAEHALRLQEFMRTEAAKANERERLKVEHERRKAAQEAEAAHWNTQVDAFELAYSRKERDAVVAYNEMVLEHSQYPESGFPKKFRVGYDSASAELAIEYDLPVASVVPFATQFHYVRERHIIKAEPRRAEEMRKTYEDVVASIALRTMHEVFKADHAAALRSVAFTGIVDTIEPAGGQRVRVPVVSVRAGKAQFAQLRLEQDDLLQALHKLGARVSSALDRLEPVRPVVDLDRFEAPSTRASNAESLASRPDDLVSIT